MATRWQTLLSRARGNIPPSTPDSSATSTTAIKDEPPAQSQSPKAEDSPEPTTTTTPLDPQPTYPTGLNLALLLTSLMTTMFLVALDRLIIATAVPRITDDFHSAADVGWYASSFLLTNAAFQLAFGKLYTFYSVKRVFLASVLLFEAGSAVCGAAGGSAVFIFGRALSGVGGAGIFSGAVSCLLFLVVVWEECGRASC